MSPTSTKLQLMSRFCVSRTPLSKFLLPRVQRLGRLQIGLEWVRKKSSRKDIQATRWSYRGLVGRGTGWEHWLMTRWFMEFSRAVRPAWLASNCAREEISSVSRLGCTIPADNSTQETYGASVPAVVRELIQEGSLDIARKLTGCVSTVLSTALPKTIDDVHACLGCGRAGSVLATASMAST